MTTPAPEHQIQTAIWLEEPEPNNPFATRAAYCHGYDVYGEMLGRASWIEMLYLLLRGERPLPAAHQLLENLAIALANPGPRDPSVHAAMCGAVGGSPAAAMLMAALGVGAGQYTGAREVYVAMQCWLNCGTSLPTWQHYFAHPPEHKAGIWSAMQHPAGFDPHGVMTATIVLQTLQCLAGNSLANHLRWLLQQRSALEQLTRLPLSMTGVAAAAFVDLGYTPEQGEMLFLLLRLPGAAAHALEQVSLGHKKFPLFEIQLLNHAD